MNPFSEHRKAYITACSTTAVIYAYVSGVGVNHPMFFRLVDGFIYGIILWGVGFILGNIYRYAIPASFTSKYRLVLISVLAVIASALVTTIESFAIYLCFPYTFDSYVSTLPVRVFMTFLILVIHYLSYLFFYENIGDNWGVLKRISEEIPMDSSKKADLPKINGLSKTDDLSKAMDSSKFETINPANNPSTVQIIDRITVRIGHKIRIIPVENILYIKAERDYISIHTAEGSWLKEQTMKDVESRLPLNRFVRIHRSYIVNLHQISRIERYGEKQQVVLHNNEKIKISVARYQTLRQILGI